MNFLSEHAFAYLKKRTALIVASRVADRDQRTKEILAIAATTFGRVIYSVPEDENERGWPASPNFMFRHMMQKLETLIPPEPMFLCEPDAIPLVPDWLVHLETEYQRGNKPFMGFVVERAPRHIAGVAVYPPDWRKYAPKIELASTEAWDAYAADEILAHAHPTRLIQHVYNQPPIHNLGFISDQAVIFHQDKRGQLIWLLDQSEYGGELYAGRDDIIAPDAEAMTKYYMAENAGRTLKSLGYSFKFNLVGQFAGTWRGVYESKDVGEQVALDRLTADPRSAVVEIPEERYMELLKKKPRTDALLTFKPSSGQSSERPITQPEVRRPPQANMDKRLGVVVEGDNAPPRLKEPPKESLPETADEVIGLGKVEAISKLAPVQMPRRPGRPRKNPLPATPTA